MPFERETLTQLRDAAVQDVSAAQIYDAVTGQLLQIQLLPLSPLRSVCYMTSGGVYSAYGYLDWIALQSVPWTATDEYAVGWGALKGKTRKPATAAGGRETVPGPINTPIPAGTILTRSDGVGYATTADATTGAAGSALIAFAASVVGADGNAAAGIVLTFLAPIAGLPPTITTANPITGGADVELLGDFRDRYLLAYAEPAAGGSETDYEQWALDVPGVTRAWCNPLGQGAGTVVVYTMQDGAEAAANGFPQGANGVATAETRPAVKAFGDLLAVADALYALRPATALVYFCAPAPLPVAFTLANLGAAPGAALLADIQAVLTAMFLRIGSPLGVTLYPNNWEAALASVAGLTQYTLVSPIGPIVCPVGSLAVLGAVSATA